MNKNTLNTLIICLLLFIIGLAVYILLFNNEEIEEIKTVRLNEVTVNLYVGESKRLTILPSDTNYNELIWESNNDNTIDLSSSGVVKGKSAGTATISVYLSDGTLIDTCLVTVSNKQGETTTNPTPTDPVNPTPVTPVNPTPVKPTPTVPEYTVKFYDASIIETDLTSFTLLGSEDVPRVTSKSLYLSPNVLYVVSFDYKTVRGTNKFNIDLNPDSLPEIALQASTITQHYDWEVISGNSEMKDAKLRFFDNVKDSNERDIIVSNVIMGTVRKDTKKKGDIIGTMPTPARVGYTFAGWYTKPIGGTKISATTVVNENMILYPHWEDRIRFLPSEYVVPSDFTVVTNLYTSNTLKYKTIKHKTSERYYSLIWVQDAYKQLNSANNNLRGGKRQELLNMEITSQNLASKGMIATNGSFSISDRSNTPAIATKGNIVTNNRYSSRYAYGTLTLGSDSELKLYSTTDATALSDWLRGVGARNTWAITHFETTNWNGGRADGEDRRTSLCQIDKHNFVLYAGYSLGIGDYMKELHDRFGCKVVVNLDGGGSTGMYYKTRNMSSVGVIYEYKRSNDCCRVIGDMLYFTE